MDTNDFEVILGIKRNRNKPSFKQWCKNHLVGANSFSLNPNVLLVYHEILENLYVDSEYWTCGHGNDTIAELLSEFSSDDLEALKTDLPNWHLYQLDKFCDVLKATYDQGSEGDLLIGLRINLYSFILSNSDILTAIDLMFEDFEFLKEGIPVPEEIVAQLRILFDKIEATPGIVGEGTTCYIRRSFFNYLKNVVTALE